mgnify:FL=1
MKIQWLFSDRINYRHTKNNRGKYQEGYEAADEVENDEAWKNWSSGNVDEGSWRENDVCKKLFELKGEIKVKLNSTSLENILETN